MRTWLALLALLAIPAAAAACTLCGALKDRPTLGSEWSKAARVVVGQVTASRLNAGPGALPGSGSSDVRVVEALKPAGAAPAGEVVKVEQYLPIADPNTPNTPTALLLFLDAKGALLSGRNLGSPALLGYAKAAAALPVGDRPKALQFYLSKVADPDEAVAEDAFLELARATDAEIGQLANGADPVRLREIVRDPKAPALRLGLLSFLLGARGNQEDADWFEAQIKKPSPTAASALDGLFAGLIQLRPKEGWELLENTLADRKGPVHHRMNAARVLKFFHGWTPKETKAAILRCQAILLEDPELADLPIDDMRQWKMWDLAPQVVALFGRKEYECELIQRGVVRFALAADHPKARELVTRLEREMPEVVKELRGGP